MARDPTLARVLVEPPVDLHFREGTDEGAIILAGVSKGRLVLESLLVPGSLVVPSVGHAAFSRADAAENEWRSLQNSRIPEKPASSVA